MPTAQTLVEMEGPLPLALGVCPAPCCRIRPSKNERISNEATHSAHVVAMFFVHHNVLHVLKTIRLAVSATSSAEGIFIGRRGCCLGQGCRCRCWCRCRLGESWVEVGAEVPRCVRDVGVSVRGPRDLSSLRGPVEGGSPPVLLALPLYILRDDFPNREADRNADYNVERGIRHRHATPLPYLDYCRGVSSRDGQQKRWY